LIKRKKKGERKRGFMTIRELNHNAMLICFCEPPLKDQPDYRMVELLPAVCNNIRWGGNPICLLIIIRKAIRQLE